jgi:hypothetical protein
MERDLIAKLNLNDLRYDKPDRPGWSVTFGSNCADAASICLEDQCHSNPVYFQIEGIGSGLIEVEWSEVNDTMRRFNADREVSTEYGAYGMVALIMPVLTNLTVIERSMKGRDLGFDFWLGELGDASEVFQRKARLEVSGIRNGSPTQVQSRVNIKLRQISPSDAVAPGYVAVIEFGTPQARIVEKCRI